MKKNILYLCAMLALLISCSEDEQPQVKQKEQVQFELGIPSTENSDGRTAGIPPGAKASITILTPEGPSSQTLDILAFGESFLTAPIELTVGAHKLTDFLVLTADNEVIYAAPKEGSPLASAVNNALPQSFNVHKGKIKNVAVQVIEVGDSAPEAFGYASFGIEVVKPLAISVFIEDEGQLTLASARGKITGDAGQLIQEFTLDAETNFISFLGADTVSYTLTIEKDGYRPSSRSFRYNDLTSNHAISVVLETQEFIMSQRVESNGDVLFNVFTRDGGTVTVDWGDGTSETASAVGGKQFEHTYAEEPGEIMHVRITGDLDRIFSFAVRGLIDSVDLSALPNLEVFAYSFSDLTTVDVSQNPHFRQMTIDASTVEDLIVGEANTELKQLYMIDVVSTTTLTEAIQEFHSNALAKDLTNGLVHAWGSSLVQLTEDQKTQLRQLRDYFEWDVQVENQSLSPE
jgi:hypothetical protein